MKSLILSLLRNSKIIKLISSFMIIFSLFGILSSSLISSIKQPINLGMDFLGGNEIRIERQCINNCSPITSDEFLLTLNDTSVDKNLISKIRIQVLNQNKLISIRTPFLSVDNTQILLNNINKIYGPLNLETKNTKSIGPKLGRDLLINAGVALLLSLSAISIYLSIRFDRKFALIALIALFHDLFIVFGIFSWLGIFFSVEVNSLFAVSLLTIAGYSVNDTVVIFDRIRENLRSNSKSKFNNIIEISVNESLRRTLFTSMTTIIPLITLIVFGSYSLFWFSISLVLGIIIGSYSSILLAPSLLLKNE